ncbi:copper resistance protein CopC [Paenibacillus hemerocallicola]|uniref:Copper resistance protein CopC n=2 Tax=Paenibacillus hemerocallicola TaxID=1172614 RepID=A0A5C4TIV2_9BACL|nr:copper resistance protein CopC [Paenibacillus hemerocallicola]
MKGCTRVMNKTGIGLLLSVLLLLLAPATVFAHTGLQSSSPAKGETIDKPLTEIRMEFSTDIEPLSTFELKNEKNESVKVSGIGIDKSAMSGKINPALPNGEYTVTWKIIGRDGHPVENKFSFTVNMPQQPNQIAPDTADGSGDPNKSQQAAPESESDKTGENKTVLVAAIALLAAALLVALAYAARAKRKKT